jgi:hypothetical protein
MLHAQPFCCVDRALVALVRAYSKGTRDEKPEITNSPCTWSGATANGACYRYTLDRSDGSGSYDRAWWDDIWDATPEGEDVEFAPWNREPQIPEECWHQISAAEYRRDAEEG